MAASSEELSRDIARLLDQKLGEDIVCLDMRELVTYTDYLVICTARNERQAEAIADLEVDRGDERDRLAGVGSEFGDVERRVQRVEGRDAQREVVRNTLRRIVLHRGLDVRVRVAVLQFAQPRRKRLDADARRGAHVVELTVLIGKVTRRRAQRSQQRQRASLDRRARQRQPLGPTGEAFLGARDADVGQAPLFLHLLRILQAARVRQQAILHTNHEHNRELQPFGRMQRQQGRRVALLRQIIRVSHERHLFQEEGQVVGRGDVGVTAGHIAQFKHVVPAVIALGRTITDRFFQACVLDDRIKQLGHRSRRAQAPPAGVQFVKITQGIERAAVEGVRGRRFGRGRSPGAGDGQRQGFERRLAQRARPLLQGAQRFAADAARGHVDDAAETDPIKRVVDGAQERQRIFYLFAFVEARRAHQLVGQAAAYERLFQRA